MPWNAGLATRTITPRTDVWLAGYGTKRAPSGKLHDLRIEILALDDAQGGRAVLMTSDLMGLPRGMYEQLVIGCRTRFELTRSQIMFTFSHNHCGPRLEGDLIDYYPVDQQQEKTVAEYSRTLVDIILEAIGEALGDLQPARLEQGQGTATFAVNRRNNPEGEVEAMRAQGKPLKGPVDHTVPVLAVYRGGEKLDALLFGYACHPTTLSFTQWCGDYPGFAKIELESDLDGVTAMFINTCGGDQNPLPRRQLEFCREYGHQLAVGVHEALKGAMTPVAPPLATAFAFVDLPFDQVMTREQLETGTGSSNAIHARWATRLLKQLDNGKTFETTYLYPVQAWRLGNEMLLLGMGAEAVVDYALRFKKEYGPGTWVCGYANDLVAYIPSRRVWEEGGYEGGPHLDEYGHPALRWSGDVEERVTATVRDVVDQVRPQ